MGSGSGSVVDGSGNGNVVVGNGNGSTPAFALDERAGDVGAGAGAVVGRAPPAEDEAGLGEVRVRGAAALEDRVPAGPAWYAPPPPSPCDGMLALGSGAGTGG